METENLNSKSKTKIEVPVTSDANPPRIYHYLDFRSYLSDFYQYKKSTSRNYSYAVFAQKAQISTRNYLKRIIDGERPLSSENLPRFVHSLELSPREALYFECLVNFNQSKNNQTKKYYFQQLRASAEGVSDSAIEISNAQYEIFSHWYVLPILESLDLRPKPISNLEIADLFKGRVSANQVKKALETLAKLGLVQADLQNGGYQKSHKKIRYEKQVINLGIQEFHKKMLQLSSDLIAEEDIHNRYLRGLTISLSIEEFEFVKNEIADFFQGLNDKYSTKSTHKQVVSQINIQALKLTEGKNGQS